MNKKFFAAAAIAALMGVGGYFAKSATTQNDGLSDLEIANAEALAEEEGGTFEFSNGYPYITKCNVVIGSNWLGNKYCKVEVIICQGGGSGCNSKKCPSHPA